MFLFKKKVQVYSKLRKYFHDLFHLKLYMLYNRPYLKSSPGEGPYIPIVLCKSLSTIGHFYGDHYSLYNTISIFNFKTSLFTLHV